MRLDEYLLEKKMAANLQEARGFILAGRVLVNDTLQDKCGARIKTNDSVRLRKKRLFASRAAEKILPFLQEHPSFIIKNKTFLDIGASSGGFTSLLLQQGAKQVIALDVGYGLLESSLRTDARVHVLERTHVLQLQTEMLPFVPDAFVMDISFISLRRVLPFLMNLFSVWEGIVLLKPQFEWEFADIYKDEPAKEAEKKQQTEFFSKGVIRSSSLRRRIIDDFRDFLQTQCLSIAEANLIVKKKSRKLKILAEDNAALAGSKGNVEYIFWLGWD